MFSPGRTIADGYTERRARQRQDRQPGYTRKRHIYHPE